MKKVLFFHHASNIGGASISGLNLLNAIPKDSFKITVYCNSIGGPMADIFEENGYNVIRGNNSPVAFQHFSGGELFALSFRSLINYILILFDKIRINKIIVDLKPDIVIVNSMTLFWIGRTAKKYDIETICFFRETYVKGLFGVRTWFIKQSLSKYFDKIAFISKYDMDQNKKVKSKKQVIYNTLSVNNYTGFSKNDVIENLGLDKNEFKVLFVGGMLPLKGADIILKALIYINEPKIKLVFVGYKWNGKQKKFSDCKTIKEKIKYFFGLDFEKKCIDIILENNLAPKIQFFSPQEDMSPFYLTCDVLVFPAIKPHQARPLFEAGNARIPVVISDFPNIRESVDSNSGFLFKNKDSKQLAKILDQLIKETSIVEGKVNNNFNIVKNRHLPTVYKKGVNKLLDCDNKTH